MMPCAAARAISLEEVVSTVEENERKKETQLLKQGSYGLSWLKLLLVCRTQFRRRRVSAFMAKMFARVLAFMAKVFCSCVEHSLADALSRLLWLQLLLGCRTQFGRCRVSAFNSKIFCSCVEHSLADAVCRLLWLKCLLDRVSSKVLQTPCVGFYDYMFACVRCKLAMANQGSRTNNKQRREMNPSAITGGKNSFLH